jgi:KDO2-lipid IV(A) lauroyltransferase
MEKVDNNAYRLIRKAMLSGSRIPRKLLTRLAHPIGTFWYAADRYHRDIALSNMINAFPGEMTASQCRRIVQKNFIQLTRVALELPSLFRLDRRNLESYAGFCGENHLRAALTGGKGVLFLTAHLGNWELMALATPLKFDFPVHVLVRPLDHKPLDAIFKEIRTLTGNRIVDKDNSAGLVRELLRRNQIVAILLDQNASWYEGVYVPFFGRTACTNKGLALFALRYGATVLPAFNVRQKDGRYKIMFEPPVNLVRTGDIGRDVVENTRIFNEIIEKYIRMAPDNWLWVHRRWRIKDIPESARRKMRGIGNIRDVGM